VRIRVRVVLPRVPAPALENGLFAGCFDSYRAHGLDRRFVALRSGSDGSAGTRRGRRSSS